MAPLSRRHWKLTGDTGGFFGGAQLGYNWQAAGSPWVFGLEADVSFGDIDGTATFTTGVESFKTNTDTLGTVRARLGYAVDRALWYVTGGLAWANHEMTLTAPAFGTVTSSNTHLGWAIGGGLEWAFADAWTAKIEYLYVGLGFRALLHRTRADRSELRPRDPHRADSD